MRIAEIVNNSSAEVKGHFTDMIYFQGCDKNCPYCFNKDFIPTEGGKEMSIQEIVNQISNLSDVVMFTGGEPLMQDQKELMNLVSEIRLLDKKIVLETARINGALYLLFDKVYFCAKTYMKNVNWNFEMEKLNCIPNAELIIVIGHQWFDREVFKKILRSYKEKVWLKYYDGIPCDMRDVIHLLKLYKKKYEVIDKLCL